MHVAHHTTFQQPLESEVAAALFFVSHQRSRTIPLPGRNHTAPYQPNKREPLVEPPFMVTIYCFSYLMLVSGSVFSWFEITVR